MSSELYFVFINIIKKTICIGYYAVASVVPEDHKAFACSVYELAVGVVLERVCYSPALVRYCNGAAAVVIVIRLCVNYTIFRHYLQERNSSLSN